jgi:hypothetical protein
VVAPQQNDTARSVLITMVRDLGRDLRSAKQLLGRIDPQLRRRVEVRMGTHLERGIRQADQVLDRAKGPDDPADVWADVHALRWETDELLRECLVLVKGSSDRALGLDDGWCSLADALVDELVAQTPVGHWSSFTVVGGSDQYSRASRVIQVRFPPTSIWQLPIVAHELGHFVGPALVADRGLRGEHPLTELGNRVGDGSDESWAWLDELFADAFATRLLGPAYGFTCVMAAFDPLMAEVPTPTHPPAQQRVGVISAMLARAGAEPMPWLAEQMAEIWDELVAVAGGREGRAPGGESPFRDGLAELLDDLLPISAYIRWPQAQAIAAEFRGESDAGSDDVCLADVLNAAWQARRGTGSPTAIDDIAVQAEKLYRIIANGTA